MLICFKLRYTILFLDLNSQSMSRCDGVKHFETVFIVILIAVNRI